MLDILNEIAARSPHAIIGLRGNEVLRADAFLTRVQAWRTLSLRTPGASVGLYLEDSLEFGAALLGAWQAGKTVWLAANTLEPDCRALAASVDALLGEFPPRYQPLVPAAQDERCGLPFVPLHGSQDALVVLTSGSTGAAQAIPKKLSQLVSEVATLEALFGTHIGDAAVVATVSHQHIYGLLFKVLWPLAAGRATHARTVAYPEELADLLGQVPCVLVGSPAHLKRLPAHLDWSAAAGMLRAVFSSGGPLPPEVSASAAALLAQVPTEIYGSSESGGIAWRQRGTGDAWRPLPGVEWRVGDSDGHLEVQSPHLPDQQWLRMADRIEACGDGRFLLLGRSDRIVKIEEKRISLDALEAALLATGIASEARVLVGANAPGQRTVVAAFLVLNAQGRAMLDASGKHALDRRLREQLARSVERVALPRRWRYLESMPVDAQGKTTHAQLAGLLGAGLDPRPRLPQARLLAQDPLRVLFEITAPANLFYFDGHFAQVPILPGVVQVDWAILYGRRHFALGPAFRALHALKFQNMIGADAPVLLELVHDAAKDSLAFRYFSEAGQHSGGRIVFGPSTKSPC